MNEDKERARMTLEDAVLMAIEYGFSDDEVRSEVEHVLENVNE